MARARSDLVLLIAAVLAGAFFFASLDALWPLAPVDLTREPAAVEAEARVFLRDRGLELAGGDAAASLRVDEDLLEYLQRSFGLDGTRALIRDGAPVYRYVVLLKRRDDPDLAYVAVDARGGIAGWGRTLQD
ncbi:MAG: hypothetical protein ACRD2J_03285, partial [Thermoanaerobaculia bacterium]